MRWLVEPWLTATGRAYERKVDPDLVFSGDTRQVIGRYIYVFGIWQPNLTAFMASHLDPGRTFVDVGANVGWFTLQGARRVGPHGRVVAIEASPNLARRVDVEVERNGLRNVRVVNAAVWSGPGKVDIHPGPAENPGKTSVSPGHEVRCDTLMNLLTEQELATCRLVKIDVEGAEREVVKGIDPERFPPDTEFVIEVDFSSAAEIFARFDGYNAFLLPNTYRVADYMFDRPPQSLKRLTRLDEGAVEVDVVLSRADAVSL
jgi:FkbM family methyltransferase